jgi:PAS domain S-box-containing protein
MRAVPRRSRFWRYGVAVLAVAIALVVKLFLATLIHQESPFMLFFVAIVASAWYGGMAAGLVATALAAVLCDYFFLTPKYLLSIVTWGQAVRLAVFVLEATCICIVITMLNSARVRAQRSQVAALHCQAILLQSEERFRLLIEGVKDYAIFMLDPSGIVASWNAGAARITGYKAREVIGQHYSRFYTYSDIESGIPQQELRQAIAHEQFEIEGWRLRRDGSQFWANVVTTSLKDSNGQIKGFSQIVRDITERQRTEELLRQSEERLRLALEAAQIGTWDWNLNTQQLTWSSQQEILFDLAPGTFIGTYAAALDRIHPADRTSVEAAIAHAIESTGTFNREFRILSTDGSIRWLSGQGKVFYDDAGRAMRLTGINRDISEQKQTIAEIQAALQEKEVVLQEVHYRVKNNLHLISNFFNLQSTYVSDRPTLEILKVSENRIFSIALAYKLLSQSQDFTRINLAEYIAELSAHLSNAANLNAKRVTFKVETEPIWVSSDIAISCGAIVNELVTNTLKYAFSDERSGQIHITLKSQDRHHIILKIGDNGIGLPLGFDWQNTEYLGLQIVATLVNQIQGSIDLTNKEPGTEFTIIFTKEEMTSH